MDLKLSFLYYSAPIAQLDRAMVCGTIGQRFESSWARSLIPFAFLFESWPANSDLLFEV